MRSYLVAVVAMSEQDVHEFLNASTKGPNSEEGVVDSWWIAEDDRQDGSVNHDSAIFVPQGAQMDFASVRDQYIQHHKEEWDETGYPYAETDKSGCWYAPKENNNV